MSNSMDCIFVKVGKKIIALKDFLKMDTTFFNEAECKIQEALTYLYEKNKGNPPLFKKFPNRGNKKLIIDSKTVQMEKGIAAQYSPDDNVIEFTSTREIINLTASLAHELKHAEQTSEEYLAMNNNNRQEQQVDFITETQAKIFQTYVSCLLKKDGKSEIELSKTSKRDYSDFTEPDEVLLALLSENNENQTIRTKNKNYDDYLERDEELLTLLAEAHYKVPDIDETLQKIIKKHLKKETFNYAEYEKEAMIAILPMFYTGLDKYSFDNYSYREEYDKSYYCNKYDDDLKYIPRSFNLPKETQEAIFPILKKIPPTDIIRSSDAMYRYFLYIAATGDYKTMGKILDDHVLEKFCPIHNSINSNIAIDATEYAIDVMVKDHAQIHLPMFFDWPGYSASREAKLQYLKYRVTQHTKGTADKLDEIAKKINDEYLINEVFSNISSILGDKGNLSAEQQKQMMQNSTKLLFSFLDLKDEDDNPVILSVNLRRLVETADKKTLESLAEYQQKNPTDPRFAGISIPSEKKPIRKLPKLTRSR